MSEAAPPPLERQPARLSSRRCLRHPQRDAAARCVECGGDYCRECVSEYSGQLLCASCLEKAAKKAPQAERAGARGRRLAMACLAFVVLWGGLYGLGAVLVSKAVNGNATLMDLLPNPNEVDEP